MVLEVYYFALSFVFNKVIKDQIIIFEKFFPK